jgi:signal transduction histidine kinase
MVSYSKVITQLQQTTPLYYLQPYHQAVLHLLGRSKNLLLLKGEIYDEELMLPVHQQANDRPAIYHLHINKVMLCYLFGEYNQAIKNADIAAQYIDGVPGTYITVLLPFYDSLARLAVYHFSQINEQGSILSKVQNNQDKIKNWANYAPMNHLQKFYLVEAERYRVIGNNLEAMDYYDRAIATAKENEYLNEEALAHELAAKFYLEWGKENIAQLYLTNAYYTYARWGSSAKVNDLEKQYPELLAPIFEREKTRLISSDKISVHKTIQTPISNSTDISNSLDLATLNKAYQALTSEIKLDKLISKLMQVVMENAGAENCTLSFLKNDTLIIEAVAVIGKVTVLKSIPVADSLEIPITLLNYVLHTRENLVIDDATRQLNFASDPYIIRQQPKSLLCVPIINQEKLIAVLYLENNLTTGAFTSDRLQTIKLLCSQAAISLENARLYQQSQEYAQKLENYLENLQQMQLQLVQSEKMSALGNLVAGVAHEINNPVGFIGGNIHPAIEYIEDLFNLVDLYQQKFPNPGIEIEEEIETIDLEYLREDLPKLLSSMKEGVKRIRNISTSLLTFSRADNSAKVPFDIHEGIDSTILILKHRLKKLETYRAINIIKNYGDLPPVNCFPGQLNQVFMNLLANAIDALEESNHRRSVEEIKANPNKILIQTELTEDKHHIQIRIKDNGIGMCDEIKHKIFEHLFTTKAVGKGTGLGLSIARQIVVEKHGGTLKVNSALGEGTEFVIQMPI